MEKTIPTYYITIDEMEDGGIDLISLVENPAIMIKGLAFNKEEKRFEFKYDNDKQIIAGPAIIPDLPIYRYDDELGEYYVVFTKETIEKMVDRFNQKPKQLPINLEHSSEIVPAFIKGSWIIEDGINDKSQMYGFTDLPVGTFFIEVKVTDKEYWKKIKESDKTGFSIEGMMGLSLAQIKKEFRIYEGDVNSSNVESYRYNDVSGELILTFNDGSRYRYYQIDFTDYENIVLGEAECITDGENEYGSWFEGKTPSVGAAVWQYLIDKGVRYEKLSVKDVMTFESYNDYPKAATENACKVLRWRDEHGDEVQGMTQVGWTRANQLCNGENISEETIARMSGFQRHKQNSEIAEEYKGTPWKDRGYVAWLGWGGTEGIEWASNKLEEIRNEQLNKTNKKDFNMKNKKLIFRDYTLKNGAVITIEGDMAIGSFVYLLQEDGSRIQAPEGEHILEDGTTIFVDAEGYINEVRTAATTETEENMEVAQYQVTPEEVMAVVNPIFDEMRRIIGELQARVDMLEGNMPKPMDEEEMEEFSRVDNLKFRLSRIRATQV
jgi:hypothetical protein